MACTSLRMFSAAWAISFPKSVYTPDKTNVPRLRSIVSHSITNGSVFLIVGSLLIGFLANDQQAQGIKPFTTDIFKGFLAIFLLDMGLSSGRRLNDFFSCGWFPIFFAIVVPAVNGVLVAIISSLITDDVGNRFMFAVLAASASYIAVPAAMKIAAPGANPGIYLPMTLVVTFPFNITLGMPLYLSVINSICLS
ncbi:MAG: sodium-dependent bicarbonate transport family permease [Cyclobacteriaceae bacterium]|nr:sodium-dependent bicarbonate transport family permease [Cyclobacteriaceae bacterium]